MTVAVYMNASRHQQQWCGAFIEGLRRHGLAPVVVDGAAGVDDRSPAPADVAVFWGYRRRRVIAAQRDAGADYIVLERGFLGDRMAETSAGWNGLNGRASFNLPAAPTLARFDAKFGGRLLRPWRRDGDYGLILGQVPGDMSVHGLDLPDLYAGIARDLARLWPGLPLRFRPHPQGPSDLAPAGVTATEGSLAEDLDGARFAVTWNSNSGVDAALAGVPVYVLDAGGMARPVAAHALCEDLYRPDRETWAAGLAWCQWTVEEFRRGEAWAFLTAEHGVSRHAD